MQTVTLFFVHFSVEDGCQPPQPWWPSSRILPAANKEQLLKMAVPHPRTLVSCNIFQICLEPAVLGRGWEADILLILLPY